MPRPLNMFRLPQVLKSFLALFKPYLRWVILGGTLFFVVATFRQHWNDVAALRIDALGWARVVMALGATLLAHVWSGWVWGWILRDFDQSTDGVWSARTYLKTNIAKYLPGNVWHFYGRVLAAKRVGVPLEVATLSVLLEPLLMAAAALAIALLGAATLSLQSQVLCVLALLALLLGLHPLCLNRILAFARSLKKKSDHHQPDSAAPVQLQHYPMRPLLGEGLFVLLRGVGFLGTMGVFTPLDADQLLPIISAFSGAWLLGLVIPGAPGGIGVFEATIIALLGSQLSSAAILGSVALYRGVSLLAEAGGAGLAWLEERL